MSELALKLIAENKAKHARGEDARVLDLAWCGLKEVPEEIGDLVWLEELSFTSQYWRGGNRNNIAKLSSNFSQLTNLKILRLNGDSTMNNDYDFSIRNVF